MGTGSVIRPGDVQRMSTGITHSEFNPSRSEPVHLLQVWILPDELGLKPGYEQNTFPNEEKRGRLRLLASRNGREGSLTIHQDVDLYASILETGEEVTHTLSPGRHGWLQLVRGAVSLIGQPIHAGDGAAVSSEQSLEISPLEPSEFLLFDLT